MAMVYFVNVDLLEPKFDSNVAESIVKAARGGTGTLCGFEESQAEADLSGKKLGPQGAILVAWDIRAGFVSTSMKKIKVNECELPIDVLKTGVEVDLSSQKLRVEDAIIIAACINVSSSMKSLK